MCDRVYFREAPLCNVGCVGNRIVTATAAVSKSAVKRMSDIGRKRGAAPDAGGPPLSNTVTGTGPSSSSLNNSKRIKQEAKQQSLTSLDNGHPSAIIAPRCTYGLDGAKECPHVMVSGGEPRML